VGREIESTDQSARQLPPELAQALGTNVAAALAQWQVETGNTVLFDRWLTPGKSSALVAAIALSGPQTTRRVVLKICPPGQTTGREPALHAAALSEAPPDFAARHLVGQPMQPIKARGGWWIMFQQLAGGSMRALRALSTQRGRNLPRLVASIVSSVLDEWNSNPQATITGPAEFLREHLGTRLESQGPFDRLVAELSYSAEASQPPRWVRTSRGMAVPNAVAWIRDEEWRGLKPPHLLSIVGFAHGDLQPDNILLSMIPQPDASTYWLIDLSAYSPRAPLTRDPAHLLQGSGAFRTHPVLSDMYMMG
jgi:hypothetical protein